MKDEKDIAMIPYFAHEGIVYRLERSVGRTQLVSVLLVGFMAAVCVMVLQKQ